MSVLSLQNIVSALKQYSSRYKWLDVFAHQVRELRRPSGQNFLTVGNDLYHVQVGSDWLEVRVYPDKGVARFSLANSELSGTSIGAVSGAALGALIGASTSSKGPEGTILGLLMGGLVGAAVGNAVSQPDENRIMTLRYDPTTVGWQVYHGPYIQWAKEALRPG